MGKTGKRFRMARIHDCFDSSVDSLAERFDRPIRDTCRDRHIIPKQQIRG